MGIGYADIFLITFLTHPGVVIPEGGGSMGGISLPKFPTNWAAVWQCLWYWILSIPANGKPGASWTMFILEIVFLCLYLYFFAAVRLSGV
jgi:hypothetical protein